MLLPDLLYYTQSISTTTYERIPTGRDLSMERLIRGEACWASSSFSKKRMPKKLVLADWAALGWSKEKIIKVQQLITELFQQGFEIYLWQSHAPKLLSKDDISHLSDSNIREAMIPPDKLDKIKAAMIRQNPDSSPDSVFVLDHYWINHIVLEHTNPQPYCIRLHELTPFISNTPLFNQCIQLLKNSTPPVNMILCDAFSDDADTVLSRLKLEFPTATIQTAYQYLDIFERPNHFITLDSAHTLNLYLKDLSAQELKTLLDQTPELIILHLQAELSDLFSLNVHSETLPNIQELELSSSAIHSDTFKKLLFFFTKLQRLSLYRCEKLNDPIDFTGSSAENLTEIILTEQLLNPVSFHSLLSTAQTQLKKLKLYSYQLEAPVDFSNIHFEQLEEMTLYNCTFLTIEPIISLLMAAATQLKRLELDTLNNLNEELIDDNIIPFEHLEELIIRHSKISLKMIKALVTQPLLKKLTLEEISYTDSINQIAFFESFSFQNLVEANLIEIAIPTIFLGRLFETAPLLQALDLTGSFLSDEPLQLSHTALTTLCLDHTRISISNFNTLLIASPLIKKLHLLDCYIDAGQSSTPIEIEFISNSNLQLSEILVGGPQIGMQSLTTLIKAAPNLIKLNLWSCDNLWSDSMDFAGEFFSELLEIQIHRGQPLWLSSLLLASPRLTKLTLTQSSLLDTDLPLEPDSLPNLEELYFFNDCRISPAQLISLLRAAPNLKNLCLPADYKDLENHELEELLCNHSLNIFYDTPESFAPEDFSLEPAKKPKPAANIQHDSHQFKDFEPNKQKAFKFSGKNKTKNQDMIIEKLSQYFTVTQSHLAYIPKIQVGICKALSHYYLTHTLDWDQILTEILQWNGRFETITPALTDIFQKLWDDIEHFQLPTIRVEYLGDNIALFLQDAKHRPSIINNPWHAIAIQYNLKQDHWEFYDPNDESGPKVYSTDAALLEAIHKHLGPCIGVEYDPRYPPTGAQINNPGQFIQEGGLVSLTQAMNTDDMLKQIQPHLKYTQANLEGILLRSTAGFPAWKHAMQASSLVSLTLVLIMQFIDQNPADYVKKLHHSIALLTPLQMHELIVLMVQHSATLNLSPAEKQCLDLLINLVRTAPSPSYYEKALHTWTQEKPLTSIPKEYYQHCVSPASPPNHWIECQSNEEIQALSFALQKHCKTTQRPVFYIHSPEDLICRTPHIVSNPDDRDHGHIEEGFGGPLYEFLRQCEQDQTQAVLIVNYSNFTAEDIVKWNALLDKKSSVDEYPLPKDIKVIGLVNPNDPNFYTGTDFSSRFGTREKCPIGLRQLAINLPSFRIAPPTAPSSYTIHLFNGADWKSRLLGQWIPLGNQLVYEKGELEKALENSHDPLVLDIHNGLWDDPHFVRFWQHAFQNNLIHYKGRTFDISRVRIREHHGYDWDSLTACLIQEPRSPQGCFALNPQCFGNFLPHLAVDSAHQTLIKKEGLIKVASGTTLTVHLTREISLDQWAMLLTECLSHGVKLIVQCALNVTVPTAIQAKIQVIPHPPQSEIAHFPKMSQNSPVQVIHSQDIDTTVAQLKTDLKPFDFVMDISECSSSDLFFRYDGGLKKETLTFQFTEQKCSVLEALEAGHTVVLKGRFSQALADELAPYLLEQEKTKHIKGKLILVCDTPSFQYAPHYIHSVTKEEKIKLLQLSEDEIDQWQTLPFENESLSQLQARVHFLRRNPHIDSSGTWDGMRYLAHPIQSLAPFDASTSATQTADFSRARLDRVNAVLHNQPYVFLSGLSGVGKTSFVEYELCGPEDHLYRTSKEVLSTELLDWVHNTRKASGKKILFIDEANLANRDWSEFEGLFEIPRYIVIQGQKYPLTPEHQVVFAGNPLSYGDERIMPLLFQGHGNAVVFEPLPTAVLYEKILKPITSEIQPRSLRAKINHHLLNLYRFLCDCSTTDVLISPRELQMMALLTLSFYHQLQADKPVAQIAQYFAYHLAKDLVPPAQKEAFDSQFRPPFDTIVNPLASAVSASFHEFLITESRQQVNELLNSFLSLRTFRLTSSKTKNEAQLYGGLGGMIVEGEPGIGKSELVISALLSQGYQKIKIDQMDQLKTTTNNFIHMPVSLSLKEKETLLLTAFNAGAVVIIDEINSSPMMEALLNNLLMGKSPLGEPPEHPGFMIIGTQNPKTMAGRRAPSTALSRRLTTVQLAPYSSLEIKDILISKELAPTKAECIVTTYQKSCAAAKREGAQKPGFRDIMNLGDDILHAQKLIELAAPQQGSLAQKSLTPTTAFLTHTAGPTGQNTDLTQTHSDQQSP